MTDFCRLCALRIPFENLTPINDRRLSIRKKLLRCCQLELSMDDDLPQNACDNCMQRLDSAWTFAESVHHAQDILHKEFATNSVQEAVKEGNLARRRSQRKLNSSENESKSDKIRQFDLKSMASIVLEQHSTLPDIKYDESDENSSKSHQMVDDFEAEPERITDENEDIPSGTDPTESVDGHNSKPSWKNLSWNCCECGEQFTNTLNIEHHFIQHHSIASLHVTCSICPLSFKGLHKFVKHVRRIHRKDLEYCCDVCAEFFTDETALTEHKVRDHSKNGKKYICSTCGKIFDKQQRLYYHIRCHTPAQKDKFICDICKKEFNIKRSLASHMQIHAGIREHICDQCGRSFVQKGNLIAHFLSHSKARLFACSICGKTFKTPHVLHNHTKSIHLDTNKRPHKCRICNKDFTKKTSLSRHMLIHTNDWPWECEFCSKRFRAKGDLVIHRRLHTGERPYSCMDCNRHFSDWSNYHKHMIGRHGIDIRRTIRKPEAIPFSDVPENNQPN